MSMYPVRRQCQFRYKNRLSTATYASYGCIRMFDEDVVDLFSRVKVGTEVVVTA